MSAPNWKNRTIWTGDNLDILRGMNSDTVDLIYLDPPFNSNKDYSAPVGSKAAGAAFKDTWHLSDLDVAWMGLVADEEPSVAYLLDTAGRTHSAGMQSYLTMMAVRLIEMRRVLKDTGSLYLHCDPTASHYLKLLCDAIFGGGGRFRNEIIWKRSPGRSHAEHWGNTTDTMLYYAKGTPVWNDIRLTAKNNGATRVPLDAAGIRYGASGEAWRDYNPSEIGRHWAVPRSGTLAQWIEATHIEGYAAIDSPHERLDALERAGLIEWSSNGRPAILRPPEADAGVKVNNLWTDIKFLSAGNRERTGYPTQKPLALLERIILASSNEGDVVLDPFCGCATACVAAEKLGREWVGIDLSEKAAELVNMRLADSMGSLFHHGFVTTREDIPRRTDVDAPKNYRKNAHVLYGEQEGRCGGCRSHFEFRHFEVDHMIPRSRGGTDHLENLQLLCGSCNRIKGDRTQEYLMARLAELEVVAVAG